MENIVNRFKSEMCEQDSIEWAEDVIEVYKVHEDYYRHKYGDDVIDRFNELADEKRERLLKI